MAKATTAAPTRVRKNTVSVTYLADKVGDPSFTKWNGITFKANVPVELDPDNDAHYLASLLPTRVEQGGEVRTKHVEGRIFMGDLARTNPSFEVDGAPGKENTESPPPGAEWTIRTRAKSATRTRSIRA